jgi:hypothetical protein
MGLVEDDGLDGEGASIGGRLAAKDDGLACGDFDRNSGGAEGVF